MQAALRETAVLGVVTNLDRLQAILAHPQFRSGELHTHFLDEHLDETEGDGRLPLPGEALAAVVAALHGGDGAARGGVARELPDPWRDLGGWRLP